MIYLDHHLPRLDLGVVDRLTNGQNPSVHNANFIQDRQGFINMFEFLQPFFEQGYNNIGVLPAVLRL